MCLHSFCWAHGKAISGGAPFLSARPWTGAAVACIPSTLYSQEIAHYYKAGLKRRRKARSWGFEVWSFICRQLVSRSKRDWLRGDLIHCLEAKKGFNLTEPKCHKTDIAVTTQTKRQTSTGLIEILCAMCKHNSTACLIGKNKETLQNGFVLDNLSWVNWNVFWELVSVNITGDRSKIWTNKAKNVQQARLEWTYP